MRYLRPLYITKECLGCHGDPKGELDVKEGYRESELRGAVSVTVPAGT